MASFERVLMPGLDKDQYSVLWVEHQDKGRLELNFLIPNMELLTGRRLQPYYDRADRPRIDAWQTIVNGRLGLHDPNAPENRRALVMPVRAAGNEAGSRSGDYAWFAGLSLVRGAENASGRH
ncbi:relaxase/mobilization nuclease domain-containing protein (plasmid) [Erwinia aphidicola]